MKIIIATIGILVCASTAWGSSARPRRHSCFVPTDLRSTFETEDRASTIDILRQEIKVLQKAGEGVRFLNLINSKQKELLAALREQYRAVKNNRSLSPVAKGVQLGDLEAEINALSRRCERTSSV